MRFSTASVASLLFLAASVVASPVADGSAIEARATEANAATEANSATQVQENKADSQWFRRPWGYGRYGDGYGDYGYGGGHDSRYRNVEFKETDASADSRYGGHGYHGYDGGYWAKREVADDDGLILGLGLGVGLGGYDGYHRGYGYGRGYGGGWGYDRRPWGRYY